MLTVDNEEYWNERLKNETLTMSVYAISDAGLKEMEVRHMAILEPYKNKRVLDAGCAYGRMSKYFTDYVGVDFAPGFINKANELFPDKTFVQASLKSLPFKDNEFDLAFCVMVKGNVSNNLGKDEWDLMEKELRRVAKDVITLEP
jgi:ubiquinone/menaquinone biosynthesis C-methylase UbiE